MTFYVTINRCPLVQFSIRFFNWKMVGFQINPHPLLKYAWGLINTLQKSFFFLGKLLNCSRLENGSLKREEGSRAAAVRTSDLLIVNGESFNVDCNVMAFHIPTKRDHEYNSCSIRKRVQNWKSRVKLCLKNMVTYNVEACIYRVFHVI